MTDPSTSSVGAVLDELEGAVSLSPCPRDTNGDGDCGRRYCPICGERRHQDDADLRAALGRLTEGRAES